MFTEASTTASDSSAPDARRVTNTMTRKKPRRKPAAAPAVVAEDDILPEYDFSNGRRNPYAARLATDAVTVVLDPDVARLFPDARAVNEALRALARSSNISLASRARSAAPPNERCC